MTFLSAWRLWFLLGVAALALGYLLLQRQRSKYVVRFSSAELFDAIAPNRPGVKRHFTAFIFLAALAVGVAAFAQPATEVRVPRERATVIVAIDVSLSMQATDVEPDRLQAAQEAANRFIDELPPTLNVGIVSFAGTASVLVPPSLDRAPAHAAINNLRLAESTAIGEAIFTSIDALQAVPADNGLLEPPPARVVLLSDGETTVGRSDQDAIQAALGAEIPISTIAFGTDRGTILYDDPSTEFVEDDLIPVPVREDNLERIADETDGVFFTAGSLEELEAVYADIGSAIGFETIDREITDWFVGIALALLAIAATLNLAWYQRLP